MTILDEQKQTVLKALQYLAGVCDYANTKDDAGFNGVDAIFGHSLAEQGYLTNAQAVAALKMVRKYHRQIESVGITLPDRIDLPEDGAPEKSSKHTVSLKDGRLFVTFDGIPSKDDRNWMKEIRNWKWHPELTDKPWSFPADAATAIIGYFKNARIDIDLEQVKSLSESKIEEKKPEIRKSDVTVKMLKGKLAIFFDYDRELVDKARNLSERKFINNGEKYWECPTRLAKEINDTFPGANWTPEAVALLQAQKELASMSRKAASDFEVPGLRYDLFPFQKAGIEFLVKANGRAMVGDEMGLGKTIQSIGYLQISPDQRPAMIVVPASLKVNWKREIEKWMTSKETVIILEGTKPYDLEMTGGTIFIINYDILKSWTDQIVKIKPLILIADEAHKLKNKKALRTKAFSKLAKTVQHTILLTGTPIVNRPVELFTLLNLLNPKAWDNFWRYAMHYCDAHNNGYGWDFSGSSNLEQLHEEIKPYVIRRLKSQVLKELPAKRRVTMTLEISDKARGEYDLEVSRARDDEKGGANHLTLIERLKQVTVKGKLDTAIDWIEDFIESEKLVVFITHVATAKALMERFGDRAVEVTGSVSQKNRQDAVDRFQNDDNVRLFVGNIQAAGVGLTLTASSNVAFLEFGWTPGDHDQAEDRCHRIGQDSSVTAWYLVAQDTIDEDIVRLLEEKRKVVDMVHDGKPGDLQFSIMGDLIQKYFKNGKS